MIIERPPRGITQMEFRVKNVVDTRRQKCSRCMNYSNDFFFILENKTRLQLDLTCADTNTCECFDVCDASCVTIFSYNASSSSVSVARQKHPQGASWTLRMEYHSLVC